MLGKGILTSLARKLHVLNTDGVPCVSLDILVLLLENTLTESIRYSS